MALSELSKLDLATGFHQVPIKLEDKPKTAFVTQVPVPFGLRNGPSVFQRLMDIVLHDVLYCSFAYIDDIVVHWKIIVCI